MFGPRSTASRAPLAEAGVGVPTSTPAANAAANKTRRTSLLHRPTFTGSTEPIREAWCSTSGRTSEEAPLDDDGTLADRARSGDVGAYELLVERHQDIAVRVAALMCGPADAPDVTQEAFVKAWRALDRFRSGAPFRPWLLAIVGNEARNAARSAGRRAALAVRATEPTATAASTEDLVLVAQDRDRLLNALDQLAAIDRDVISCRYLADLSERETAAVLGCRAGTVKSRLSRALERLRVLLDATPEPAIEPGGIHGS
jgi:RNA polymerase sigma-70 factor (ECF subfamily)